MANTQDDNFLLEVEQTLALRGAGPGAPKVYPIFLKATAAARFDYGTAAYPDQPAHHKWAVAASVRGTLAGLFALQGMEMDRTSSEALQRAVEDVLDMIGESGGYKRAGEWRGHSLG